MNDCVVSKSIKSAIPTLRFRDIKNAILGTRYQLSVVFVGEAKARRLNKTYRDKTYIPNVLSFPLDDTHGEIFIAPRVAAREANVRHISTRKYIAYLLIHGLLHLKGHRHGDTMEKAEKKYLKQFELYV